MEDDKPEVLNGASYVIHGQRFGAAPLPPGLYIVSTPIGNLLDISLRALATLAGASLVLAEDTRVTKKLLSHYGIATRLRAYNEHNGALVRPAILAQLKAGQSCALVSDAGTPLISDPGYRLVYEAAAADIAVFPIPGASAVLAGLVASGLPTDHVYFEGFLPNKSAARRRRLQQLKAIPATLVLFEAPQRLPESLADIFAILGDRPAVIARELTKRFETLQRSTLQKLVHDGAGVAKGEFVLLVGQGEPLSEGVEETALEEMLVAAMRQHSLKDASDVVAGQSGLPRRLVYAKALRLQARMSVEDEN